MVKNVLQIECGVTLNVDVDAKNQKNVCKNVDIWNPNRCSCQDDRKNNNKNHYDKNCSNKKCSKKNLMK